MSYSSFSIVTSQLLKIILSYAFILNINLNLQLRLLPLLFIYSSHERSFIGNQRRHEKLEHSSF